MSVEETRRNVRLVPLTDAERRRHERAPGDKLDIYIDPARRGDDTTAHVDRRR